MLTQIFVVIKSQGHIELIPCFRLFDDAKSQSIGSTAMVMTYNCPGIFRSQHQKCWHLFLRGHTKSYCFINTFKANLFLKHFYQHTMCLWRCYFFYIHRNGQAVRLTALVVFPEDVEACLQHLQWIPELSTWLSFRFCEFSQKASQKVCSHVLLECMVKSALVAVTINHRTRNK